MKEKNQKLIQKANKELTKFVKENQLDMTEIDTDLNVKTGQDIAPEELTENDEEDLKNALNTLDPSWEQSVKDQPSIGPEVNRVEGQKIANINKKNKVRKDVRKRLNLNKTGPKNRQNEIVFRMKNDIIKLSSLFDEVSYTSIRKKVKGTYKYFQIAWRELSQDNIITKFGRKWKLVNVLEIIPSMKDIVFGVFHSKIGGIPIYPVCQNCINSRGRGSDPNTTQEIFSNWNNLTSVTNCDCNLPNSNTSRDTIREDLSKALESEGVCFIEYKDRYGYLSYKWTVKTDLATRRELTWTLLIYLDMKAPSFNKDYDFLKHFIKNYDFSIQDMLDNLSETPKNEFENTFYFKLFDKIMELYNNLIKNYREKTK